MLNGKLLGKSALNGEIQREVIKAGGSGGSSNIDSISVDGVEIKPDSNKNVNIDLSGKVDKTDETNKIYGTDESGNQKEYSVISSTYTANTIVQRSATGTIATADPQWGNDATNKRYVDNLFNGANKAVSFVNYSTMISSLNSLPNNSYNVGQNIMIVTLSVPDLWVSEIVETSSTYTYVSDDDFVNTLNANGFVQVGYYKLSALETQKVDLTNYVKDVDYATAEKAGLVRVGEGLTISSTTNKLNVTPASEDNINNRTGSSKPITPSNLDFAVKKGLSDSKLSGTDKAWSEEEKTNARNLINAVGKEDYAGVGKVGVVRISSTRLGVSCDANGNLSIQKATNEDIDAKEQGYTPIVPVNLDYAIKKGLSDNKLEWTEEEKLNARELLGISEGGGSSNESQQIYDLVIRTQGEFDAWCETLDNGTCRATSVLLVGDGGTPPFLRESDKGLKIPQTLINIHGIGNPMIAIVGFIYDESTNPAGIYCETQQSEVVGYTYNIENVSLMMCSQTNTCYFKNFINVNNCGAIGLSNEYMTEGTTHIGFENCCNVSNCTSIQGCINGTAIAYNNCENLNNCLSVCGDLAQGSGATLAYSNCNNIVNVRDVSSLAGNSNIIMYENCTNVGATLDDINNAITSAIEGSY